MKVRFHQFKQILLRRQAEEKIDVGYSNETIDENNWDGMNQKSVDDKGESTDHPKDAQLNGRRHKVGCGHEGRSEVADEFDGKGAHGGR